MICTEHDEFIEEIYESIPRWEAILTDGTKVFYDDDRPGTTKSSWERLRDHCHQNGLKIKSLKGAFRDNVISLPENKDGYYFRKMARGFFGSKTRLYYLFGYIENGIIQVRKYSVPEFLLEEESFREICEDDLSLIR